MVCKFGQIFNEAYLVVRKFRLESSTYETSAVVYEKVEQLAVKVNRARKRRVVASTVEIIRPKSFLHNNNMEHEIQFFLRYFSPFRKS